MLEIKCSSVPFFCGLFLYTEEGDHYPRLILVLEDQGCIFDNTSHVLKTFCVRIKVASIK